MQGNKSSQGKVLDTKVYRDLYPFLRPYVNKFVLLVVVIVATAILAASRPFIFKYTIDHHIASGDLHMLGVVTIVVIALLILQFWLEYVETFLSGWLGQTIIRDIRVKLYDHLLRHRLTFFDRTPIGQLITRNISDIETLSDVFSEGVAAIFSDLLQLFFILGFMFYTDWRLTLVSLSMLPFLILATYVFKESVKRSFNEVRTAVAALNTFVQEHITGMAIVQIFNSEKREYEKFKEINKVHLKANLRSVWHYSVYFPIAEVISAVGIGLLVWYGAHEVIKDKVTLGTLVAFIMYINMFFRPVRMIADKLNTLQMGIVSSERVLKLLHDHELVQVSGNEAPLNFEGNVQFQNVRFAYLPEQFVLKGVSFGVNRGQMMAIVGATGAGKSSIINLLNRFYEYNDGHILIDGKGIKEYDLDYLRSKVAVVLQDVFLFSDSIYHNITLWDPAISLEKVKKTAQLLGADKFIEALPGGYNYNVMERGATLSVGQRQLISFVRAMVRDPAILILDEATSSIDDESERTIQHAINKMMEGRTSIVIAHRLSTIRAAHHILVLDKGEVKEQGTHAELLEQKGLYSHLHQMQFKELESV